MCEKLIEANIYDFISSALGIHSDDVQVELTKTKSYCVKMNWLRQHIDYIIVDGEVGIYTVEQIARGYLLFLL